LLATSPRDALDKKDIALLRELGLVELANQLAPNPAAAAPRVSPRNHDPEPLALQQLTRDEFDLVVDWAAGEGWNPGLGDSPVFWDTDPDGFVGVHDEHGLAAAGSIVSYDGQLGFMGFFIVRPELRGAGLGRRIWYRRRDLLLSRLQPGAAIGMDGVFNMQPFYAEGGFVFSHRNLRMSGVGREAESNDTALQVLGDLPFAQVAGFDRRHFGVDRANFLRPWIKPVGGLGLGLVEEDGELRAIGVARKCREGFKIGPLFADQADSAERILLGLGAVTAGQPIFLDVPEKNAAALALAQRHGMQEVFGCARMYLGRPPSLPWSRIFGVTSFELG
jgi:GNAT superfamily N-acetyltransferase